MSDIKIISFSVQCPKYLSIVLFVNITYFIRRISSMGSADLMQSLGSDYAQLMDSPEEQAGM